MQELREVRELLEHGSPFADGLRDLLELAGGMAVEFEKEGWQLRYPPSDCKFTNEQPLGELGGGIQARLLGGNEHSCSVWARSVALLVRAGLESRASLLREQELHETLRERLLLTHDMVGIGMWECRMDTKQVFWSEQQFRIYGSQPGSRVPTHQEWLALIHPDDRDFVENHLELSFRYREPYEAEFRIIWADGTQHWLMSRGLVLSDPAGNAVKMTGLSMDITAQKRIESELRESEERYRMLADHIDDVVSLHDPQGVFLYVSPSFTKLSAYPAERIIGAHPYDLGEPEDRPQLAAAFSACAAGKPVTVQWRSSRRDGSEIWLETRMTRVQDGAGRTMHVLCVSRDVTERLVLEDQLRQSQKMDAVGKLAGGIAHDFNNLLTVINGYAELVLLHPETNESAGAPLRQIHHAGLRAASLTQQLLAFSRKQMLQPKIVSLNAVITGVMPLLERLIPKNIVVQMELQEELQPVKADPTQLEQVVMNLVLNARDAMPEGGQLWISTRTHGSAPTPIGERPDLPAGCYACLTIRDTGSGMTEATKRRIFEPFYTTKDPGKGTGLGLSTAYGIVKQSGGDIWVRSESGVGSTFYVALPTAEPEQAEQQVPQEHKAESSQPSLRILLAEDDAAVRELTAEILRRSGFEVLEAADGSEAWNLWTGRGEQIDLLITDMMMPNMTGSQLAAQILSLRPDIPVLYISGYPEDLYGEETQKQGTLLSKPFTPQLLIDAVQTVLRPQSVRRAAQG